MMFCLLFCLCRLEDISEDADLQEKSESDLKNLGEMILKTCEQVMKDFEVKLRETTSAEGFFWERDCYDLDNISNPNRFVCFKSPQGHGKAYL